VGTGFFKAIPLLWLSVGYQLQIDLVEWANPAYTFVVFIPNVKKVTSLRTNSSQANGYGARDVFGLILDRIVLYRDFIPFFHGILLVLKGLDDFAVFQLFDGLQAGAKWIRESKKANINFFCSHISLQAAQPLCAFRI
jgi:hypothetical protein